MKRGERADGKKIMHCGIGIASKWNYCPICGAKRNTELISWVRE